MTERTLARRGSAPIHALSVDVETFLESNLESFGLVEDVLDARAARRELQANMEATLAFLADRGVRATMFALGTAAQLIPDLLSRASSQGHEIACHGMRHVRLFGLTPAQFRRDLEEAKDRLEQVTGTRVVGFRAPEFSITKRTLWALDVLAATGFEYDSSIYPIGFHDVYGIHGAAIHPTRLDNGLIEFPLATAAFGRLRLPAGGGGYLRVYPLPLTEFLISRVASAGHPAMVYVHPYELGPIVPEVPGLSRARRFRHYHNTHRGQQRLGRLLDRFRFAPAFDVLSRFPVGSA